MNTKTIKEIKYWTSIVVIGMVVGIGIQFTKAWTEPTASAPGGNLGAPINTGGNGQYKVGGLILNTGVAGGVYAPNGLIVQNGNVGIGTVSPDEKVVIEHADGTIRIGNTYSGVTGSGLAITQKGRPNGDMLIGSVYDTTYSTVDSGMIMNNGSAFEGQVHTNKNGMFISTNGKDIVLESDFPTEAKVLYLNGTTGNVGIGTKSPTAKLDVDGDVCATTGGVRNCLSTKGTGSGGLSGTGTNNVLAKWTQIPGGALELGNSIISADSLSATVTGSMVTSGGALLNSSGAPNGLVVWSGNAVIRNLASCSGKLYTDAAGKILCGTDNAGAADNLGNHIATQDLNINNKAITNVLSIDGTNANNTTTLLDGSSDSISFRWPQAAAAVNLTPVINVGGADYFMQRRPTGSNIGCAVGQVIQSIGADGVATCVPAGGIAVPSGLYGYCLETYGLSSYDGNTAESVMTNCSDTVSPAKCATGNGYGYSNFNGNACACDSGYTKVQTGVKSSDITYVYKINQAIYSCRKN